MSRFLKESGLTERRAFIETFVKEIAVVPGDALMRYAIPMPEDSRTPGGNAEDMALNGSDLSTVKNGGAGGLKIATKYGHNASVTTLVTTVSSRIHEAVCEPHRWDSNVLRGRSSTLRFSLSL